MEFIRLWELGSRGRGWCMGIEDSLGRSACIKLLPECLVVLLQLGKPSEERLESALKDRGSGKCPTHFQDWHGMAQCHCRPLVNRIVD